MSCHVRATSFLTCHNMLADELCCCLQGHFAPSSTDSGSTGSIIFDFYWGAIASTVIIMLCD